MHEDIGRQSWTIIVSQRELRWSPKMVFSHNIVVSARDRRWQLESLFQTWRLCGTPDRCVVSIVVISSRVDFQDLLMLAATEDQVVHELLEEVTWRALPILGEMFKDGLSIPTLTG